MSEEVLNFAWNTQKTRTKGLGPDNRVILVDMSPLEIIKAPNRHSVESIIDAMCKTLTELVEIQETQARRVLALQKTMLAAAKVTEPAKEESNGTSANRDAPRIATTAAKPKRPKKRTA